MEYWKKINKNYKISSLGRVMNRSGNILKPQITNSGYNLVHLLCDGIRKAYTIHRLVAVAFIPNPESKLQVNHIDGNKLNNKIDNLEWVTNKENLRHAFDSGLMDGSRKKASERMKEIGKLYGRQNILKIKGISNQRIIQMTLDRKTIKEFESFRQIQKETGLERKQVSLMAKKGKPYKGFLFEIVK